MLIKILKKKLKISLILYNSYTVITNIAGGQKTRTAWDQVLCKFQITKEKIIIFRLKLQNKEIR